MDVTAAKEDEESNKIARRWELKQLNDGASSQVASKSLDSSLKRHTALIKRMKQSLGAENRDHIIKDIDSLGLEKYIDEIAGAAAEGVLRCKSDKDVWSAVEIISALHRRFPTTFTPSYVSLMVASLAAPGRNATAAIPPELKDKEDSARISRQRPLLRVCSELALVGVIRDGPQRSGGEWIMTVLKDLLSNDPSLTSLPLLTTFLKSFARPFLGLHNFVVSRTDEGGEADADQSSPQGRDNAGDLVEQDIRDRFKRMCEAYFDKVSKKLVSEFNRLQDQDRRNHEAYIRSGEIFEDRQQAYEKMTKNYEKILAGCQSLSELLQVQMPILQTAPQQQISIGVSDNTGSLLIGEDGVSLITGGPWEDEEDRKFHEELSDLADSVPKSFLGVHDMNGEAGDSAKLTVTEKREEETALLEKLNKELEGLSTLQQGESPSDQTRIEAADDNDDDAPTPVPATPAGVSTPTTADPTAPVGPSQLLTALLARLPDATNRTLIDQAAIDFAYLNRKAARKRLVKFLGQIPKNRIDLIPYYARLVATLNKYMPDVSEELLAILEEEFRYLNRKRTVKELGETRMKNIAYISALTKFRIVPWHTILHMLKVFLDDFTNANVENVALMLEGCGRFLLRTDETRERMSTMLELMKRKQSLQIFDQRQILLLENAYYQCNPPERGPREEKQRTPDDLFIRHLIIDVLSKKTLDKVLRLLRKLDWKNVEVVRLLRKYFTKPWKVKHVHISLLAMLVYDLNRYHPDFVIGVVDQIVEDVRRGLEHNIYTNNQRRVATVKYVGELYIYRMIGSGIIFDTLWTLITFGHPDGRPLPGQICPIDTPDDFFRVRLACILLDTCGMCFDRGAQKRKLDSFLTFFQLYVFTKTQLPMDIEFMYLDSLEALRPKLQLFKSFEDAAAVVDAAFASTMQGRFHACQLARSSADTENIDDDDDDSADGSDSGVRRLGGEAEEYEETDQVISIVSHLPAIHLQTQGDDRPSTPDAHVLRPSKSEDQGPSQDADAEFLKELAKMTTDSANDNRKVDKRTALALWDAPTVSTGFMKKRPEEPNSGGDEDSGMMKFSVITRRGHKQLVRDLAVPSSAPLAVHTRSAQLRDRAEQEHLKRLVLNYEQREGEAAQQVNGNRPGGWG